MKSLHTLIKVQKSLVDDHRRMLAQLQDVYDRIEEEIAATLAAREHESLVAGKGDPLARLTLEPYLSQLRTRLEQLQKARQDALDAIEVARDKLAEMFETQKRYEIIRDQRAAAEAAAEAREEQLNLDELASQAHERKQ